MSETDPHDGDSCAEVERRLEDAVGELNSIGMLLARYGCTPRQPDGTFDYVAAVIELAERQAAKPPRVWLPGDEVPAGTWAVSLPGYVEPHGTHTAAEPLVEVVLPDFAAAVAAEEDRRALSRPEPSAEAGSGNGASEARSAGSVASGASHGPAEGEGSAR